MMLRIYVSLAVAASLSAALLWSGGALSQGGVIWGDPEVVERLLQKRQEAVRQRALRNDQIAPAQGAAPASAPTDGGLGFGGATGGGNPGSGQYALIRGGCVDIDNRSVCVNNFRIAVNEISNADYRRFLASHNSGAYRNHNLNADRQPVARVSYEDALRYARWLSQQTGQLHRLPTRAEWRYAASRGNYSSRDLCAQGNVADQTAIAQVNNAWQGVNCNDNYGVSSPVGSFAPDTNGLRDMLGNVWEWVCTDEQGRCANGTSPVAMAMGGGWSNGSNNVGPNAVYSPNRQGDAARLPIVGFRLVQEVR